MPLLLRGDSLCPPQPRGDFGSARRLCQLALLPPLRFVVRRPPPSHRASEPPPPCWRLLTLPALLRAVPAPPSCELRLLTLPATEPGLWLWPAAALGLFPLSEAWRYLSPGVGAMEPGKRVLAAMPSKRNCANHNHKPSKHASDAAHIIATCAKRIILHGRLDWHMLMDMDARVARV